MAILASQGRRVGKPLSEGSFRIWGDKMEPLAVAHSQSPEIGQDIPHDELAALLRVSAALAQSLELAQVLQTAIESAVEVLGLDSGVIYLLTGDTLYLGAATPPLPPDLPDEHRHAVLHDHPHLERCVREMCPVVINDALEQDLSERERIVVESANLRSAIFSPLAIEGHPLGAAIVHTVGRTRAFSEADVDLCRTVSHQISLAVANARLYDQVQRTGDELRVAYDATLKGWSLALEMRDEETNGQTERVTDMTVHLAAEMGVTEPELTNMRRGALLHDIGKMCVPDAILHKPGPLTEHEWAVMRQHPEQARRLLLEIGYLAPALDIPYCHHERWDGKGYPRGLREEEIPLSARIFAVVDVFDALISDRPYRKAWSRDDAIAYIEEESGRHFDPAVAEAFLRELVL